MPVGCADFFNIPIDLVPSLYNSTTEANAALIILCLLSRKSTSQILTRPLLIENYRPFCCIEVTQETAI